MKNQNRNNIFLSIIGGLVVLASTLLFSFIEKKDSLAYTGRNLQLDDPMADEFHYPATRISFNDANCIKIERVKHENTGGKKIYTVSEAVITSTEIPTECANPNNNAFRKIELNGSLNFHFQKYSLSSDFSGESAMYTVTVESFHGVLEPQGCKKPDSDLSTGVDSNANLFEIRNTEVRVSFLQRLKNRFKSL